MGHRHRHCVAALAMATLLPWLLPGALPADDLNAVRESVQGSSSSHDEDDEHSSKRRRRRHHDHCDDDDGFGDWLIVHVVGPPVFYAVSSPWWVPAAAIGDDYTTDAVFPHYPYFGDGDGYLQFDYDSEFINKPYGIRLTSEYGTDFAGLERVGGRFQFDSSTRFGLDTEWNSWREKTAAGDDTLWTGDANLIFRFAQSEQAQFYTGLGVNWLAGGQSDAGVNFTYGFDWFPAEPVVIRSVLDAGTLGDAGLFHSKTTIGIVYKHLEVFTGYDLLRIGGTNLQGVIAGFTIWY